MAMIMGDQSIHSVDQTFGGGGRRRANSDDGNGRTLASVAQGQMMMNDA